MVRLGAICRRHGAVFHTDATQSVGKVAVDALAMQADLLSLSGHKVYGPMGVGALVVRRQRPRLPLAALVVGGGQERGLRSGTLNVPGIVGLGAAAELAAGRLDQEAAELRGLSELFVACLAEQISGVQVNGSFEQRVPGTVNLSIEGVSGEQLQQTISSRVEISVGSACSTGQTGASHVMVALGVSDERAGSAIRLALGRFTTQDEIHGALEAIVPAVRRLRGGGQSGQRISSSRRVARI